MQSKLSLASKRHSSLRIRCSAGNDSNGQRPSGANSPGPDQFGNRHIHGRDAVKPDSLDRHSSARDRVEAQRRSSSSRANIKRQGTFAPENRRRGRPAHLRSPDDSPLRDGNRDRLIGLLTERAAKTLLVYLQETNPTVYSWLYMYLKDNPIPLNGNWDEVSGEMFLRKMLSMQPEVAKLHLSREALFDNVASMDVDPRGIAQRIMDIRVQLSKEFVQDLGRVQEENTILYRETLQASLANVLEKEPIKDADLPPPPQRKIFVHPELLTSDGSLAPEVAQLNPELAEAIRRQSPPPERSPTPSPQPGANKGDSPKQLDAKAASAAPAPAAGPQPGDSNTQSSTPAPAAAGDSKAQGSTTAPSQPASTTAAAASAGGSKPAPGPGASAPASPAAAGAGPVPGTSAPAPAAPAPAAPVVAGDGVVSEVGGGVTTTVENDGHTSEPGNGNGNGHGNGNGKGVATPVKKAVETVVDVLSQATPKLDAKPADA